MDTAFEALVYDKELGRYAARRAWVVEVDKGPLCRMVADGDTFLIAPHGAFEVAHGGAFPMRSIKPGRRLFACTADESAGYVRIGLRDGQKGKEHLHRLVARDVIGVDMEAFVVHHRDGDKLNNAAGNLEPLLGEDAQARHASKHSKALVEEGLHPFQLQSYAKEGEANGMHRSNEFWKDPQKVARYRQKQRERMLKRDNKAMQAKATRRQALNTGHKIRNEGHAFRTMDEYIRAHQEVIGRIGNKKHKVRSLERMFGSIEGFNEALDSENHTVETIEVASAGRRFAVVLSGPVATQPVVLWPLGNESPFGSGLVVHV